MNRPSIRPIVLLQRTFREFVDDKCMRMAAAISYYMVFSMPAVTAIAVSVAGFFFDPSDVRVEIREEIGRVLGSGGAEQVQTMIEHADRPAGGVAGTVVWILVLLFGATGVMTEVQAALNDAWDVQPEAGASRVKYFLVKRIVSLAMVMGVAFVLLVSLLMSTILAALDSQLGHLLPDGVSHYLLRGTSGAVSYVVTTGLFAAMYRYLPDAEIRWADVWLGAVVAGLLLALGQWFLGMYLARSNVASMFGAAGSLALILTWVYFCGLIFLFGAEFTQVWAHRHRRQ